MANSQYQRNFLKTLERGLRVLSAFTPVKPNLSLTEIAEVLGDDPSTAHRFVYTLESLGYIGRDPQTRLYHVTPKIFALAISLVGPRNLKKVCQPYLERLRDRTGETAVLSVRDGSEIVIIEVVETHQTLAPRGWLGGRVPTYCSAMGKAILAHLPEKELTQVLNSITLAPRTPKTITNRLQLMDDLAKTRQRGWSLNDEEYNLGVVSVGAPILSNDRVIAAICVDVPTARIAEQRAIELLANEVIAVTKEISALGNYDLGG